MHARFLAICLLGLAAVQPATAPASFLVQEESLGDTSKYDQVKSLTLSRDNRHLAFVAVAGDQQLVVRDGVAGKPFDWIVPDSLIGSANLERVAYVTQAGNDMSVVVDGVKVGGGYYAIGADHIT